MADKEKAAAHPYAGMSILDILWEELDDLYDQLVTEDPPEQWTPHKASSTTKIGDPGEWQAWGELRGQAQGVAYAIALVTNPYSVDVPAVKEEAKRRWELRQEEVD